MLGTYLLLWQTIVMSHQLAMGMSFVRQIKKDVGRAKTPISNMHIRGDM